LKFAFLTDFNAAVLSGATPPKAGRSYTICQSLAKIIEIAAIRRLRQVASLFHL
jgi:hypothetical protein